MYDKLSGEMAQPSGMPMTGAMDEAGWAEYQKRAEAIEKARFNRKERTEKALSELRRLLGAEHATLVPGLVPGLAKNLSLIPILRCRRKQKLKIFVCV